MEVASQMIKDLGSIKRLPGLEGVTAFLAADSMFKSIDEQTHIAITKNGGVKYNAYLYGGNIFYK